MSVRIGGGEHRLTVQDVLVILLVVATVVALALTFTAALDHELDRVDPSTTVTPEP